jgi:hypothetical protein
MAAAFKCDLSGRVAEGNGASSIEIPIKGGVFIATFYRYTAPNQRTSGVVHQEVADQLVKAVQAVFGAPEAPAKK